MKASPTRSSAWKAMAEKKNLGFAPLQSHTRSPWEVALAGLIERGRLHLRCPDQSRGQSPSPLYMYRYWVLVELFHVGIRGIVDAQRKECNMCLL